ncbi:Fic/DOC family protein [Ketogulonicigenium vulgare]|uniref:Fic/DOC family protein n=1 Tax=Ketogulonicigenium vulgare TaxID=92945 RepID=UPI00235831DC|nr:Fic family protein [Ketogulonicigenium vulgare]
MGRYDSDNRDLYPGTEVLQNLLGLTDQDELDAAEAGLVLLATLELNAAPLPEPSDGPGFSYLLQIHNALFADIYAWAGQTRAVDISKGGNRFANWRFISQEGDRLAAELAAESWLAGLTVTAFASRMAYYMGELNVLHPFRDGNGRALREYVRYLAARAGHSLTWEGVRPQEMLEASIASYHGDTVPLAQLLQRQIQAVQDDG